MTTASTRNPFQVFLILAMGIQAIIGSFYFNQAASAALRAFPEPWGRVFLAFTAVTCVVVLVGMSRPNSPEGILIERAGLYGLSGVTIAYALWAIGQSGFRATSFALILGAMGMSGVCRARQITRAYNNARRRSSGV
jgi:hypothetical protein